MEFSRIAIIGCGAAAIRLADQLRHDSTFLLCAGSDGSRGALMKFAERFALPRSAVFTDPERMLRRERPSLVAVCTWPNSHATYARLCAVHGVRGVLCESPLATSAAEVVQIRRIAEQTGAVVAEGTMWRHHPRFRRLKTLVAAGAAGELRALKIVVSFPVPGARNWRLREQVGGGALSEPGAWAVGAARALAGSAVEHVYCMLDGLTGAYATLRFGTGVVAQIEATYVNNPLNAIEVVGSDARASLSPFLDEDDQPSTIDIERRGGPGGGSSEMEVAAGALQCLAAMRNLRDACTGQARPVVDLADSYENARVIDACLQSAQSGRAVTP